MPSVAERLKSEDDENQQLEYKDKRADNKSIVKELVAFSNASGGDLVVGVQENDGEIIDIQSVSDTSEREESIQHINSSRVDPPIKIELEEIEYGDDTLLVLTVKDSNSLHSFVDGSRPVFPIRRGSTTDYLNSYEVRERLSQSSSVGSTSSTGKPDRSVEEITGVVENRLDKISGREEHAKTLIDGPAVALHVLPEEDPNRVNSRDINNVSEPRIFWDTLTVRPEIKGKELLSTQGLGYGEVHSYTLIKIDGLYEGVSTEGFFENRQDLKLQFNVHQGGPGLDGAIILGVRDALDRLQELGFNGSAYVFVSLLDANGVSGETGRQGLLDLGRELEGNRYTTEPIKLNLNNDHCILELEPVISEIHRELGDIQGTDNIEQGEWTGGKVRINGNRLL